MACPLIKQLSDDLYATIQDINNFKPTEEMQLEKLSNRLRENLQTQVAKWKSQKNPTLSYLEVQCESLKQLKIEAFKLATKMEWTVHSFGITSAELDDILIEINLKISEARKAEKLDEAKNKKIADQICAKGPNITLPRLSSPIDILQWVRIYRKISVRVDNDLSKMALIKQSLVGHDKHATHHMDSIPEVLNYIRKKYCKEDLVLSLLIGQFRELREPKQIHQSITNIEKFLITFGHMVEWGLQQNFNSKARDEVIPMLFLAAPDGNSSRKLKYLRTV